jgi:hypothetical protein
MPVKRSLFRFDTTSPDAFWRQTIHFHLSDRGKVGSKAPSLNTILVQHMDPHCFYSFWVLNIKLKDTIKDLCWWIRGVSTHWIPLAQQLCSYNFWATDRLLWATGRKSLLYKMCPYLLRQKRYPIQYNTIMPCQLPATESLSLKLLKAILFFCV